MPEIGRTEIHPFRPFNQPTTEPASDAGSVKAAVPGTFNPYAADEFYAEHDRRHHTTYRQWAELGAQVRPQMPRE
jgi:hypothetical protein